MTTRVSIKNHGPRTVQVSQLSTAPRIDESTEPTVVMVATIAPGEEEDFYVYDIRQLKVEEV